MNWNQVFSPDNLFFRTLSRGVDFVGLSLLWALLSLPVVTIGPATAALYYTVVKVFRHKQDGAFGMYLRAFRDDFVTGFFASLICVAAALPLAAGYWVMRQNISTDRGVVLYMAYYVALIVPAGVLCYLFPLLGRFEFEVGGLFRTALTMSLRHLPSTVIVVLLTAELAVAAINLWWPILVAPTLCALLTSLFLERIFPKYLSQEQAEALAPPKEEEG